MPSSQSTAIHEPVYAEDLDSVRGPHIPHQAPHRPVRRYYEDDYPDYKPRAPRPQRRKTYRDIHPYYSSSESSSPPAKPRHHMEALPHNTRNDGRAPRRQHQREDDYFSDNRHNRPRRDPRDDDYEYVVPKERHRGGRDRDRERDRDADRTRDRDRERDWDADRTRGRDRRDNRRGHRREPERKQSKWQREAKDMFKEYAVPVIKAEGGKYISKQIGALIARQTR